MAFILRDLNILRIKGRAWIKNKLLPLQIQIVGKKLVPGMKKLLLNVGIQVLDAGLIS